MKYTRNRDSPSFAPAIAPGGNRFMEYQLPQAILRFQQGFGQLIRSKQHHGIVVVLDARIVRKRYGQAFLNHRARFCAARGAA